MKMNKKMSESSRRWLTRQQKDPYVKKAADEGYRSRAAYKLIEIDDKFHLIKSAKCIVDIGAAPGGWSQVLAQRSSAETKIAAIDLLKISPIDEKVRIFRGDFEDEQLQQQIIAYLDSLADLIVSDMAPATIGHRQSDHLRIMGLVESAYYFAQHFLKKGGCFISKIFQGGEEKVFFDLIKSQFETARFFKPKSSRTESVEIYVIAIGYKKQGDISNA
ncbi:MAG: RlmE family RNA methyltransferase [Alphaproteobacteria bacterium]|nr:RlmE family RNA methyltransferase [Alphaproteobacteria bacterium]